MEFSIKYHINVRLFSYNISVLIIYINIYTCVYVISQNPDK